MNPDRRPIGYWLKHLDRLIDRAFEETLSSSGLTRRHWQVLNTIAAGPATIAALMETLQPFVDDDRRAIESVIESLRARGWVHTHPDGRVEVSEAGRSSHETVKALVA